MKAKINLKNIYAYIQGNIRYRLYYSPYKWVKNLIPKYIKEQVECRIKSMDNECYFKGFCKLCGCQTTHLQFADKACDKPCYPYMLSKNRWERIKNDRMVFCNKTKFFWKLENNKFKIIF